MHREHTINKHMMGTKAYHKLGEISRDEPDLCHIYDQDDENWYGTWVEGFGFFDVRFPKDATRDLTQKEIDHYQGLNYVLAGNNLGKMKLAI